MSPTTTLRADTEPNDRYGNSCYVLAIPASKRLVDAQQEIWRRFPSDRSAISAHITVKGTFVRISDLDEVRQIARTVTSEVQQFWISFDQAEIEWRSKSGVLKAPSFPAIQHLHDTLVKLISPISQLRYPDDPYKVHMSLTSEYEPGSLHDIKAAFEDFDYGPGFQAESVDLIGRVGLAIGGEWRLIERFPLSIPENS
ncbi:MAG: 2'-5' RNA ligase family protein [Chloroflexi bacterium]|nr:2'-5' RNA ligase family protein [Chloroflexota bacterium]